jgi:hypothetical protein
MLSGRHEINAQEARGRSEELGEASQEQRAHRHRHRHRHNAWSMEALALRRPAREHLPRSGRRSRALPACRAREARRIAGRGSRPPPGGRETQQGRDLSGPDVAGLAGLLPTSRRDTGPHPAAPGPDTPRRHPRALRLRPDYINRPPPLPPSSIHTHPSIHHQVRASHFTQQQQQLLLHNQGSPPLGSTNSLCSCSIDPTSLAPVPPGSHFHPDDGGDDRHARGHGDARAGAGPDGLRQ